MAGHGFHPLKRDGELTIALTLLEGRGCKVETQRRTHATDPLAYVNHDTRMKDTRLAKCIVQVFKSAAKLRRGDEARSSRAGSIPCVVFQQSKAMYHSRLVFVKPYLLKHFRLSGTAAVISYTHVAWHTFFPSVWIPSVHCALNGQRPRLGRKRRRCGVGWNRRQRSFFLL